jgi:hypothetical protein
MESKVISIEKKILLLCSINSNLNKLVKDGIYLSSFFIGSFDLEYLNKTLEVWEAKTNNSEFNEKLKQIVYQDLEEIEQEVKNSLKAREHIITEIFRTFELGFFSSMITLTLSQVDGIMKEITKKIGFYNSYPDSKKENPKMVKYLDSLIYIRHFSDYELLRITNRHDYELFKRDINDLSLLNRHSILHGESTEFGNEFNAIKAILLLFFISDLYISNSDEFTNGRYV